MKSAYKDTIDFVFVSFGGTFIEFLSFFLTCSEPSQPARCFLLFCSWSLVIVEINQKDSSKHGSLDPDVQVLRKGDGEVVGICEQLLEHAAELLCNVAHVLALQVVDLELLVLAAHVGHGQEETAGPGHCQHFLLVLVQDSVARATRVAFPFHRTCQREESRASFHISDLGSFRISNTQRNRESRIRAIRGED